MSSSQKKSHLISFSLAVMLIFSCIGFAVLLGTKNSSVAVMATSNHITLVGADTFGQSGLFIKRPDNFFDTNSYWGSITTDLLNPNNFYPEYKAVKKINDSWVDVNGNDFTIEIQPDLRSVIWTLKESAEAETYGVICQYYKTQEDYENGNITKFIFQIIYTDSWTYVSAKDLNDNNYIENYFGKSKSLTLLINYNDGATVFSALTPEIFFPNGAAVGRISTNEIVTTENFEISLTTLSGKTYSSDLIHKRINGNAMTLLFDQTLENEKYVLKIYSSLDERIYGQFIIDNSANQGINLSNAWVFLVAFGGLFILAGVVAFFSPVILRKVNENKVYKENMRVAKMKNPDAYVEKSGSIFDRIKSKFKKATKKSAAEEVIEKPKVEAPNGKPKFTEVLRENREKRDFMEEHGLTSDKLEEMKKQKEAIQNAEKNSFAFLREDDQIASLYEEKKEAPTIKTGSYVEDGVTFSKLDSLKEKDESEDE